MHSTDSEKIRVAGRAFLVSSGTPISGAGKCADTNLQPGFYFALSPKGGRSDRRRAWLRYFGPFQSPVEAKFLASAALAIGLIEPTSSDVEFTVVRRDARSRQPLCALTGS